MLKNSVSSLYLSLPCLLYFGFYLVPVRMFSISNTNHLQCFRLLLYTGNCVLGRYYILSLRVRAIRKPREQLTFWANLDLHDFEGFLHLTDDALWEGVLNVPKIQDIIHDVAGRIRFIDGAIGQRLVGRNTKSLSSFLPNLFSQTNWVYTVYPIACRRFAKHC